MSHTLYNKIVLIIYFSYRMERNTFNFLVYLIGPKLDNIPFRKKTNRCNKTNINYYLCVATPDSYRSISERFDVSKSCAWVSVKRVVRVVYSIRNQFIRWPTHE